MTDSLERRPASAEIVWNDEGTSIKGMAMRRHLYLNGEFMRTTNPEPISVDDPDVSDLAAKFGAQTFAEREALAAECQRLRSERDAATSLADDLKFKLDQAVTEKTTIMAELAKFQEAATGFMQAIR